MCHLLLGCRANVNCYSITPLMSCIMTPSDKSCKLCTKLRLLHFGKKCTRYTKHIICSFCFLQIRTMASVSVPIQNDQ
ncbi:hypothetical protein XELAEV_18018260mg [Xenopus laevis]|uniref:Uncharacterized protein n=1 Tax=Xenopus laevis TaxID=8355 RepID=A0A974HT84_XENLA|nr:hypothetical protein XELAEV_18018260mg [Xenopus laevis]